MLNKNTIGYHYEHILRQDLLLKLHYCNNMETARLCKIIIISQAPHEYIKQVSLALEIICGQKSVHTESSEVFLHKKGKKYLSKKVGEKGSALRARIRLQKGSTWKENYLLKCCLSKKELMYNFLEKLLTLISFHEFNIQIQANIIQLTLRSNTLRLFPEIQNHFELFESLDKIQVMLITSAKTKEETGLIWTGLLQKEI